MKRLSIYVIPFVLFLCSSAYADKFPKNNWTVKKPMEQRVFIQNNGQYFIDGKLKETDILFGSREGTQHYFFTKSGLSVMSYKRIRRSEKEIEAIRTKFHIRETKSAKQEEEKEFGFKNIQEFHEVKWLGANPDPQIITEQKVSELYNYADARHPNSLTTIRANAFKKIKYKNLYPNIDVEYSFPDDKDGYKYTVILHPGANAADVKMQYPTNEALSIDAGNNLLVKSPFGTFIDHAPNAFSSSAANIDCKFVFTGNTVSFVLPNSTITEETTIDPWVVNPNNVVWNKGFDVDYDNSGNVYINGGSYPYQIKKYSAAGTLLWSFSCTGFQTYSGNDAFYGDFAVDRKSGSVYATEGFNFGGAKVLKVNSAGALAATYAGSGNYTEMWRMAFSRCTNQAVIVGGGVSSPTYHGCYLDTNLTGLTPVTLNGTGQTGDDIALLALDNYGGGYIIASGFGGSGSISGQLIKLTLPGLLPIQFSVASNYSIKELSSFYTIPSGSGLSPYAAGNGFNGITTSNTKVYTYEGYVLKKWNGTNGALMGYKRVNFPPNNDSSIFRWSGITSDDCDNIFVGSKNQVMQYDANLNLVTTLPMQDTVYDVILGPGGNLYATGRGFVSSSSTTTPPCSILQVQDQITNASCTNPIGSATITVTNGTPAYSITWNTVPVQTGSVVTNLSSGTYIATIVDNSCPPLTTTDTIIINQSGGVAVTNTITNVNCNGGSNGAIALTATGTVVPSYTWSTGSNASSISNLPAGTYSVIIDAGNGCNMTLSLNVTQPPVLSYTLAPGVIKCFGDTTSIGITVGGGTPSSTAPTYTVAWNPPNAQGYAVHGLGIGTYGGFVTDSKGCIAAFSTTLTQPAPITPSFTFTSACFGSPIQLTDQSTPAGSLTWAWNFGDGSSASTQNPKHTYPATGNYTVSLTVTTLNGCSAMISHSLTVDVPPQAAFIGDTLKGCPVHTVRFTDASTCTSGQITTWLWNFGNGHTYIGQNILNALSYDNASATVSANYTVTLTVVSTNGCSSTVAKNNYITVYPHPRPGFEYASDDGNIVDVLNNTVHFYDYSLGASAVTYDLGDIFLNPLSGNYTNNHNPVHQYAHGDPYTYYVTQVVVNQFGCKDSITEPIIVKPTFTFYIPNSFSPNGDGINESFKGTGIGIDNTTYSMMVFDRWGNNIFKSNDLERGWDGRIHNSDVMEDVYVWKVSFKDLEGTKHEYRGIVSIVK